MYVGRSYMEFQIKKSTQKSFLRFLKEENDYHVVKIHLLYIALSKELFALCLTLTTLTSTLLPPQLINQGWNIHMRNHPQLGFIYSYRQSRDGSGFQVCLLWVKSRPASLFGSCALNISEYSWQSHFADMDPISITISDFWGVSGVQLLKLQKSCHLQWLQLSPHRRWLGNSFIWMLPQKPIYWPIGYIYTKAYRC